MGSTQHEEPESYGPCGLLLPDNLRHGVRPSNGNGKSSSFCGQGPRLKRDYRQCGANMGGYTKRVTASAGLFVMYSVANIVALLSFQDKQAPACELAVSRLYDFLLNGETDSGGFTCVVVCAAIGFVSAAVLRVALVRRNRSRNEAEQANIDEAIAAEGDLTDKQNPLFR